MKFVVLWILAHAACLSLAAHPGVGIVEDSKGNIYYTDLQQVWKISLDGKKEVVVRNVHAHELFIDPMDNLFGEHLWYNGENLDTWGHYVWKLAATGSLTKVIPETTGFLENYSFVRDHSGSMYWADRTKACQRVLRRRNNNLNSVRIADYCFKNIRNMKTGQDGTVYVIDLQDLITIDAGGRVSTIAADIAKKDRANFTGGDQHAVMGVWVDSNSNIYAAIASERAVKRFTPDGKNNIVFSTNFPWSPSGGLVDSKGNLWILEFSNTNSVRVEKIAKDKTKTTY